MDHPPGLFATLRDGCADEWRAYVRHPFVRALGAGTLAPDAFKRFLIQDYLYLLTYARAWALAVAKSDTLEDMRAATATVSGLVLTEFDLHLAYCRDWGLDQAAIEATPPSLETLAYGGFIIDRAQSDDLLGLTTVLSACLVGYAEAARGLASDPETRRDGNPYWPWIETYAGAAYVALAEAGVARLDALARRSGGMARLAALQRDFTMTVRLEAAFWDGALKEGVLF